MDNGHWIADLWSGHCHCRKKTFCVGDVRVRSRDSRKRRGERPSTGVPRPPQPSPASTHPCPKSSPCVLLPWRGLGGPYAKWAVTRVMGVRWRGPARRATGHKITTSPHQHRPATQHRTDQIFFLSEAKIYVNSLNKTFSELILSSRTNF